MQLRHKQAGVGARARGLQLLAVIVVGLFVVNDLIEESLAACCDIGESSCERDLHRSVQEIKSKFSRLSRIVDEQAKLNRCLMRDQLAFAQVDICFKNLSDEEGAGPRVALLSRSQVSSLAQGSSSATSHCAVASNRLNDKWSETLRAHSGGGVIATTSAQFTRCNARPVLALRADEFVKLHKGQWRVD